MPNPIYQCLWFDENGKDAAKFYTSFFKNSEIIDDTQMVATFELCGKKFMALNGGPQFKFNPSISFFIICEDENEIDFLWKNFSNDGLVLMPLDKYEWSEKYGWIQDKFGISWQLTLGKPNSEKEKIIPSFLFANSNFGRAEESIKFYTSIFENSNISEIYYDNETKNSVKYAEFNLLGEKFIAMDSNFQHNFSFNEAISIVVDCETQNEIDYYWNKLTQDGEENMCGWLKDKFGISWQIVPTILPKLLSDPTKTERVVKSFLQMKKFDIEKLLNA